MSTRRALNTTQMPKTSQSPKPLRCLSRACARASSNQGWWKLEELSRGLEGLACLILACLVQSLTRKTLLQPRARGPQHSQKVVHYSGHVEAACEVDKLCRCLRRMRLGDNLRREDCDSIQLRREYNKKPWQKVARSVGPLALLNPS